MGVMFTIAARRGAPSLQEVSSRLGVELGALDVEFGVTLIDPRRNLYAVMVDEQAAPKVTAAQPEVSGPYSNPPIGTFGPPEPKRL